jgi:rod shape-determining protein MreD
MIWVGYLATIALFYFFALLQNSFFTHFAFAGVTPNLVFSLFFVLLFFSGKSKFSPIFLAIFSGIILDIFSVAYFGTSIIILTVIALLFKKIQNSLMEGEDSRPFIFFVPLFAVALVLYDLLINSTNLNPHFFIWLSLNVLCGAILFLLVKKFKLERFLK